MIHGSEVRVLQALEEERNVSELADRLGLSESYVSELVSDLEDQELVYTRKEGREKLIEARDYRCVELLQELGQEYPHIDFSELFTPKTVPVLYHLDQSRTVSELAEQTGSYRNTVHRIIKKFLKRGIVGKTDSHYELNNGFEKLNRFAEEYVSHCHAQRVPSSSFTVVWEDYSEFLIETPEAINEEGFHETGPARFQDHGIPLLSTSKKYYFYSEAREKVSAADLVCHTLLADAGSRYRTYCMLLIEKHGLSRGETVETAEQYGIRETVDSMFRFLDSRGEDRTSEFPSWDGFKSTAEQYEVGL